jgi:hypothetical protein|tara:strand:+ start:897 stop:1346 length:450 start_codon:yes stop_codon:yes gene_type:complete
MAGVYIIKYTTDYFIVVGDIEPHSMVLKNMGGKLIWDLKDYDYGWLFSYRKLEYLNDYLNNCYISPCSSPTHKIPPILKKKNKYTENININGINSQIRFNFNNIKVKNVYKKLCFVTITAAFFIFNIGTTWTRFISFDSRYFNSFLWWC